MRNAAAFGGGHLIGTDVEPSIDGSRIAADDLAASLQGQLDAKRTLARGGWPQDGENRWAQGSGPEEHERDNDPQQDQQPKLLRAGRERHGVT
jgi:hypothetical protein